MIGLSMLSCGGISYHCDADGGSSHTEDDNSSAASIHFDDGTVELLIDKCVHHSSNEEKESQDNINKVLGLYKEPLEKIQQLIQTEKNRNNNGESNEKITSTVGKSRLENTSNMSKTLPNAGHNTNTNSKVKAVGHNGDMGSQERERSKVTTRTTEGRVARKASNESSNLTQGNSDCQTSTQEQDRVAGRPEGDNAPTQLPPAFLMRDKFSYLVKQSKTDISENSSRAEINQSLIKRDQEIAKKRQEAMSKARATAKPNFQLPGKKKTYSSENYIAARRSREKTRQLSMQGGQDSLICNTSSGSTCKNEAPTVSKKIDKETRKKNMEFLRSLTIRDREIAKKRREALSKVREMKSKDAMNLGKIKLPGRKMSFSGLGQFDDDVSVSSISTSNTTRSSRLDRLYEKGKRDVRTDLARSLQKKAEDSDSEQPPIRATDVCEVLDLATRRNRMFELLERNKEFALRRRKEIEEARVKTVKGPTIALSPESDDTGSVSSVTSYSSTLPSSTRLNQLYEKGKEKRLSELRKFNKRAEDSGNVLDVRNDVSINVRCDRLYKLSKRSCELGKKRRANIAKARLEAIRSLTPLSSQGPSLEKKTKEENFSASSRKDISREWYFSSSSFKNGTNSTELDKISSGSSTESNDDSPTSSGSSENNENTFTSYDYIMRDYVKGHA